MAQGSAHARLVHRCITFTSSLQAPRASGWIWPRRGVTARWWDEV